MDKPRLKAHYTTEVVGDSKVFLLAENRYYLVQGAAAVRILPYLDGRHTAGEVAEALSGELSLVEVLSALQKYEKMGHLGDGLPDLPGAELAYWEFLGVDPHLAAERTRTAKVDVVPLADAAADLVQETLGSALSNVRRLTVDERVRLDPADAPELTVVVADDYLRPELRQLNEHFLRTGQPWVLAKADGLWLWLGPMFRPGRTGCWSCMAQRIDGNRQIERYLAGKHEEAVSFRTSVAATGPSRAVLSSMLAGDVTRALVDGGSQLEGQMITVYLPETETSTHALIRLPQCPSCGDPGLVGQRDPRVTIAPTNVRFKTDGGYRVERPSETYRRLSKHISPFLGAVTNLSPNSEGENGITYSYVAGHNFAMPGDNLDLLRRNVRGQSGGKGRTDMQARVSGICEAIERYSGVWRGEEPVTRASYDELGPRAVHPGEVLLFSERQYENRASWNRGPASRLHLVPEPFRSDRPIDWSTAWSLTDDRPRQVPAAYAWFGHPDLSEHFFCFSDANGNAAGNTLEEAVLQGFCELVERDSVALWWYNRARRPEVDLDAMHDPYVDTLREYYASVGRSLWLLDFTTDLGIPAFTAVSHRTDHPVEDIMLGFGAHPDPKMAAMRALTEINQFLPAIEGRDEQGNTVYLEDDAYTLWWWQNVKLAEEPWLRPDEDQPKRKLSDFPDIISDDLAEDVHTCVRRAEAAGLELLVLDQSRPDLELSVAKVLAPGMRHFWRRLGPGRIYDVPARLGWVDRPLTEEQMNPHSVFF